MTVSGTFTIDGAATGGAIVTVIDDDANPPTVVGTTTTAADGTYSVDVGYTTTVHVLIEYEDPNTGELYNDSSRPFVHHEIAILDAATNRWDFDSTDAGTTTVADQNGGNDLSITGATWINSGYTGNGLSFDGTDDYAVTSTGITSNAEETIAVLARGIDASATDGIVASHGSAWAFGTLNYALSARAGDISSAGEIAFREYRWQNGQTTFSTGPATTTDWHLYAISIDETGTTDLTEVYVDGTQVASGSGNSYGGDTTALMYFGSDPDPGQYAALDISFAIRYDRYLTASEHSELNTQVQGSTS